MKLFLGHAPKIRGTFKRGLQGLYRVYIGIMEKKMEATVEIEFRHEDI